MMSAGDLKPGDLMSFLVCAQTIQKSLGQLSILWGTYVRGISAGARVFEVSSYGQFCCCCFGRGGGGLSHPRWIRPYQGRTDSDIWDKGKKEAKSWLEGGRGRKEIQQGATGSGCFVCEVGHWARWCKKKNDPGNFQCYTCGKRGHITQWCRRKRGRVRCRKCGVEGY